MKRAHISGLLLAAVMPLAVFSIAAASEQGGEDLVRLDDQESSGTDDSPPGGDPGGSQSAPSSGSSFGTHEGTGGIQNDSMTAEAVSAFDAEQIETAEVSGEIPDETESDDASLIVDDTQQTDDAGVSGMSGVLIWSYKDHVLTISGSGPMMDFTVTDDDDGTVTVTDPQWSDYADEIRSIVVNEGVTAIGDGAFRGMPDDPSEEESKYPKLSDVMLADSVKRIGDEAFAGDPKLKNVQLGRGVTNIGRNAFAGCAAADVTIPGSVRTIGSDAFDETDSVRYDASLFEDLEEKAYFSLVPVTMSGEEDYSEAYEVLGRINREREMAGVSALTMDRELLQAAMLRGYETILSFGHMRPCGLKCFSLFPEESGEDGENIARTRSGDGEADRLMDGMMDSEGNRDNILSDAYSSIGVGCVRAGDVIYCVACFSGAPAEEAKTEADPSAGSSRDIYAGWGVLQDTLQFRAESRSLRVGESTETRAEVPGGFLRNFSMESSSPGVARAEGSLIRALSEGSAVITLRTPGGCPVRRTCRVKVVE